MSIEHKKINSYPDKIKWLAFIAIELFLFGFLLSNITYAETHEQFFPIESRVIGQIQASDLGVLNLDAMTPVYGNQNHILFLDALGQYGTNSTWLGSIGTGVRNIVQNDWMLGGYVFGDWNKTQYGSDFWVVNPGVEFIHQGWDFHVNAYFPIQEKELDGLHTASSLGNTNYLYFSGHDEFDKILALYDVIGKGADTEIAYSMPFKKNRIRIFAGSYFYVPSGVSHITGVQGGIEFPMSSAVNLILQNSYDNIFRNTTALTIQFTIGWVEKTAAYLLQERMLDPIPRHLGTLDTGSAVLNQQKQKNTGQSIMVDDNLWFFKSATGNFETDPVTANSCTFEHPCIGLSQNTIDDINTLSSNAKLYLSPGQYDKADAGDGYTLKIGQSIFGRTTDYLQLAEGSDRPLINDTLFLDGNNLVTNLQINGRTDASRGNIPRTGILINTSAIGTVQINNSHINEITTDDNHDAVGILNSSTQAIVLLKNLSVSASASGTDSNAIGVRNLGMMQINSSSISGTSTGITNSGHIGAVVFNSGHLTIDNSILFGTTTATNAVGMGVFNEDFGTISISNTTINVNSATFAAGIFNEDLGVINLSHSTITANSPVLAEGVFNEDLGVVHITDSAIRVNSGILTNAIFNEDLGHITISNSTIIANSSTSANGILNQDLGVADSNTKCNTPSFA